MTRFCRICREELCLQYSYGIIPDYETLVKRIKELL